MPGRYGHELARLALAQTTAQKGYDIARRAAVAPAVLKDIKVLRLSPSVVISVSDALIPQSVLDNVQKNFNRAERDNDLIYHQDVPAASSLPPIQPAFVAQSLVAKVLLDPKSVIQGDTVIFGELLGWGARRAVGESAVVHLRLPGVTQLSCSIELVLLRHLQRPPSELAPRRGCRSSPTVG